MTLAAWFVAAAAAVLAATSQLRLRRQLVLLARAAHELRGSLCVVELALDASSSPFDRLAPVRAELRRAARALDHLTPAPSAPPAPVDVAAIIGHCEPAWRALVHAHGATLRTDLGPGPLVALAEPDDLARACRNLVANAAEHGGGAVRVRASATAHAVRIQVSDDGPGLGVPLDRLVAAARWRRGARGHGLAIVADFAARHRGRLLTAPSARGARLVLELPAAPVPVPPASRRRPALAAS